MAPVVVVLLLLVNWPKSKRWRVKKRDSSTLIIAIMIFFIALYTRRSKSARRDREREKEEAGSKTSAKERKRRSFDNRCTSIVLPRNQTRVEVHLSLATWRLTSLREREQVECLCSAFGLLPIRQQYNKQQWQQHSCYFHSVFFISNWQLSHPDENRRGSSESSPVYTFQTKIQVFTQCIVGR